MKTNDAQSRNAQNSDIEDIAERLFNESFVDDNAPHPGGPLGKKWELRTLADAYKPREPLQYVVDGLFPLPSLSIVYGAPGCLKSMLLADMAVCVAAGIPWLPPLPNAEGSATQTKQVPVLWIDFDNGRRRTDERFDALARARKLPPDIPLHYVSMPMPRLDASKRQNVDALRELITYLGAKLVVIDNLGLIKGDAEENSGEMGDVMGNLRWLCEETSIALKPIHHQRKSNGTTGRKGDSLRGHSSIEAALDLALHIEREDRSDMVIATATKVRGIDVPPFGAMFTYTHREGTKELGEAKFWQHELQDMSSDRAIDRAILDALRDGILNKGHLTDAVKTTLDKVGVNRIRGRIDILAATGKVRVSSGDKNSQLYDLP